MKNEIGVKQLDNGYWEYRITYYTNGKKQNIRRRKDANGEKLKTKKQAMEARKNELARINSVGSIKVETKRKKVEEVFDEYCRNGRKGKAPSTIKKQDSLWNNHIKTRFGKKYVDEISVAEINDYLTKLYYEEGRAYGYVESFIKFFYLIFGQAYSRNYLDVDAYNKLCVNKDTKIKMPKRKVNDDDETVIFSQKEMERLENYFKDTNAETAFMLGKYCGLRIGECFGLKWSEVDFEEGTITINRQMQYVGNVFKLIPVKTRNGNRELYMAEPLQDYLLKVKEEKEKAEVEYEEARRQREKFLEDIDGTMTSSLELVNTLPLGRMQTINSMKYHSRRIEEELGIIFKYHYLRHTYGTKLAEMNTPIHILCNQMGHASSKVTERYYLGLSKRGINILVNNLNAI